MSGVKCLQCGRGTHVVDSRSYNGIVRRRRACPENHRHSTVEVDVSVIDKIVETTEWISEGAIDQENIDYLTYTIRRLMLGLKDPDDDS